MNRDISFAFSTTKHDQQPFEALERKGRGHPDTLADALAERLSVVYSKYTRERFGVILHHNFDKLGLMGGRAEVRLGGGRLIEPVRVLLNGRASSRFGRAVIPVRELLIEACRQFLAERFPMISFDRDVRVVFEVSGGCSPGGVVGEASGPEGALHHWFAPESLEDLPERKRLACNDTSLGCSFAPLTPLESLVLALETMLNSAEYKRDKPWLGSDIKVMAHRWGNDVSITMALPQISAFVPTLADYKRNRELIYAEALEYCRRVCPDFRVALCINHRDSFEPDTFELYLTLTGSCIESGDEGFVGRGNRVGGLIAPLRPYTMEGICGKNPVYHTGKIYSVTAWEMARRIHGETGLGCEVFLLGQRGRLLADPWKTVVRIEAVSADTGTIRDIVDRTLEEIPVLTEGILEGKFVLSCAHRPTAGRRRGPPGGEGVKSTHDTMPGQVNAGV